MRNSAHSLLSFTLKDFFNWVKPTKAPKIVLAMKLARSLDHNSTHIFPAGRYNHSMQYEEQGRSKYSLFGVVHYL